MPAGRDPMEESHGYTEIPLRGRPKKAVTPETARSDQSRQTPSAVPEKSFLYNPDELFPLETSQLNADNGPVREDNSHDPEEPTRGPSQLPTASDETTLSEGDKNQDRPDCNTRNMTEGDPVSQYSKPHTPTRGEDAELEELLFSGISLEGTPSLGASPKRADSRPDREASQGANYYVQGDQLSGGRPWLGTGQPLMEKKPYGYGRREGPERHSFGTAPARPGPRRGVECELFSLPQSPPERFQSKEPVGGAMNGYASPPGYSGNGMWMGGQQGWRGAGGTMEFYDPAARADPQRAYEPGGQYTQSQADYVIADSGRNPAYREYHQEGSAPWQEADDPGCAGQYGQGQQPWPQQGLGNTSYLYRQPFEYRNPGMLMYGPRKKRRATGCAWGSGGLTREYGSSVPPSKYSSLEYIQGGDLWKSANLAPQARAPERSKNNYMLCTILDSNKPLSEEQRGVLRSYKSDVTCLDLENITVFQLKGLMKEYGLTQSGKKNELIGVVKSTLQKVEAMDCMAIGSEGGIPAAEAVAEGEGEMCYDKFFF